MIVHPVCCTVSVVVAAAALPPEFVATTLYVSGPGVVPTVTSVPVACVTVCPSGSVNV